MSIRAAFASFMILSILNAIFSPVAASVSTISYEPPSYPAKYPEQITSGHAARQKHLYSAMGLIIAQRAAVSRILQLIEDRGDGYDRVPVEMEAKL